MALIVLPLGEVDRERVLARVCEQFPRADQLEWLERVELRRRPLGVLADVLRRRYDAAVLVAPDLTSPRLRLTSLLLAVPRARRRWRLDLHGRAEPFGLGHHLRRSGVASLRHLVACGLALLLAEPLLVLAEAWLAQAGRRAWARRRRVTAHERGLGAGPVAAAQRHTRTHERHTPGKEGHTAAPERHTPGEEGHTAASERHTPGEERHTAAPGRHTWRVLYLRPQLWLGLKGGGSVAHTAGVIDGLTQAGVAVEAVASDTLAGVQVPTRVVRPECWFDGLGREAEELAFNLPFLQAATGTARDHQPDVIYQRHTTFSCAGALLARRLNLPLVLEFNSSEVWKGQHWGGLRLARLAARVERINLRAADLVVVVSSVLRDQLVSQGIPSRKVLVNPNGVDPRRFRPDLDGSRVRACLGLSSCVVIGFSGTFGVWHGVPTLAAVLPRVLAARPHVRFLLIGDGPLRGRVDQVVREHDLQARVALPGLVPHADMPDYLAACDVLLSPHGRQVDGGEFFGSPTKLYEYMAAGRPIVASAVGQIADVLTDGETALLVPPDDVEALSVAILRLVDDACLRTRLGAAARQAAQRRHTWRHNAERLLAALDQVTPR